MLQQLADYLVSLGAKTVAYRVEGHPTDKDKRLIVGPNGVVEIETPRPTPVPTDMAASVEDFALRLRDREDVEKQVWVDDWKGRATVFSSDPWRRGRVVVELLPHPTLRLLSGWESEPKWLQHREVLRVLKTYLTDFVRPDVLPRFRVLNWESVRKTRTAITKGAASIDAEAASRVTAGDDTDLMEEFVVSLPLFADGSIDATVPVVVLVDLDAEQSRVGFLLKPGTGELLAKARGEYLENTINAALETLDCDERFTVVHGESTHDAAK